jgi:hypothetical protein
VIAAMALGIAFLVMWLVRGPSTGFPAAIVEIAGEAAIVRESGESRAATRGAHLTPGERLELVGADSTAIIDAGAAVRIAVADEARLTYLGAERFRLEQGEASIRMEGGRSTAVRFETPHAEATLTEGAVRLEVTGPWTELSVESGSPVLTSRTTQERVVVAASQTVLVVPDRDLLVRAMPLPAPTEWGEDFENGLPTGWRGEFVTQGLPAGSRGGIAVEVERRDDGVYYFIDPPDAWDTGVVRLTGTSHLNMTYRLGSRPEWCNFFLSTQSAGDGPPEYYLNRLREAELWDVAGEWRTVQIPIALFEKKIDDAFTDESPVAGEFVTGFLLSNIDTGLDLTIDRIWFTPDGPGRVTFQPVDSPEQESAR